MQDNRMKQLQGTKHIELKRINNYHDRSSQHIHIVAGFSSRRA